MKAVVFRLASAIFLSFIFLLFDFIYIMRPFCINATFLQLYPYIISIEPEIIALPGPRTFWACDGESGSRRTNCIDIQHSLSGCCVPQLLPGFATSPGQIVDRVRTRSYRSMYQDSPTYAIRHQAPPSIPNGATISANDWFLKMVSIRRQGCHCQRVSEASHIRSGPDGSARDLGTSRRI
jgi:hypothetical protein